MSATTHHEESRAHGALRPALGGILGLLFGLAIFVLTRDVLMALVCSVPMGVTLGIALATPSQRERTNPRARLLLWSAFLVGAIALVAFALLGA